jgi:G3E family GTPase
MDAGETDVVIAEAVGSCTDITATVARPLRETYGNLLDIVPLTVVVDPVRFVRFDREWSSIDPEPDIAYLYRKQLEDAAIVAVNKADLFDPNERRLLLDGVRHRCPHAEVLSYSARTGEGLDHLLDLWFAGSRAEADLELDYDRYGRGEAELAWLDLTFELAARRSNGALSPDAWTTRFLEAVAQSCRIHRYSVGHVKARVASASGSSKASIVEGHDRVVLDERHPAQGVDRASVTVNARIECTPASLERMVDCAIAEASDLCGAAALGLRGDAFRPAQPEPTFRIPAAETVRTQA